MASSKTRWPDFLIIGAAKAGTTALYTAISRHPQVYVSTPKEPRYFAYPGARPSFPGPGGTRSAKNIVCDEQAYLRLFSGCGRDQRAGEASTAYLHHPQAAENAYCRVPSARLVAILRHPVERAYSQWLHMRHRGVETLNDFETALGAEARRTADGWRLGWLYRSGGYYGRQLQRWLRVYSREQLLILFYEDWRSRPQDALARVFAHIGVEIVEAATVTRENVSSRQPRWAWLHHRLVSDSPLRLWSQRYLPAWFRDAVTRPVHRLNLTPGPRLDPSLRARLSVAYHQDIDVVESISGRDLSHWRGPA